MAPQNYDSTRCLIFTKLRLRDSAAGKQIIEEQKTQQKEAGK